jgi:hypothetical protein
MNIEVKQQDINVSFADKSAPTFKLENENVNATLEKQDVNFYLKKHPEIQVFFESTFVGGGSGNSSIEILTPTEWTELTEKDPKTIYMIVDGNELKRLYIGQFLIGRSQEDGSIGFPYNFPIIF